MLTPAMFASLAVSRELAFSSMHLPLAFQEKLQAMASAFDTASCTQGRQALASACLLGLERKQSSSRINHVARDGLNETWKKLLERNPGAKSASQCDDAFLGFRLLGFGA